MGMYSLPAGMLRCLSGLSALLLLLFSPGRAHAEVATDFQTWNVLNLDGKLDALLPNLRASFNAESRMLNTPRRSAEKSGTGVEEQNPNTVVILRPAVGYQFLPWLTAAVGYAWQPVFYQSDFREDVMEHRTFEQVTGNWSFGLSQIRSRTRLEQRYRGTGDNEAAIQGEGEWAHRLRQQIRLQVTLAPGKPWQAIVSDEVFFHLNETAYITRPGLDQNRIFAGVGYKANKDLMVEAGYMNQYVRRFTDRAQLNHVLYLSLNGSFEFAADPEPDTGAEVP